LTQTVTFAAVGDKKPDSAPFTLSAVASSGMAVSYALVGGSEVGTLVGNVVTLTGVAGQITLKAIQPGSLDYLPAEATRIVQVLPERKFKMVATANMATTYISSYPTTAAIRVDGSLWWGWAGTTGNQIGTSRDWKFIAAGGGSNATYPMFAAIKEDGSLWTWGWNFSGSLGDGTLSTRLTPQQIGSDKTWKKVAIGDGHCVALKTDGTVWAWGSNLYGQLGDGTTTNRLSPIQVGTDADWADVGVGSNHSLGVKADGSLWVWGNELPTFSVRLGGRTGSSKVYSDDVSRLQAGWYLTGMGVAAIPSGVAYITAVSDGLSSGSVVDAELTGTGAGYTSPPKVAFYSGTGGTGQPLMKDGQVIGVLLSSAGSGYSPSTAPVVTLTGGNPVNAAVVAGSTTGGGAL
jgi:hypothetical protein